MKMASTAVEETIRKVGRLNAAAAEGALKAEEESEEGGAEQEMEDEEGTALRIDLWTKSTDATTTNSGLMELNGSGATYGTVQTGGEGSDCSSDSLVVDVLKEESPDGEIAGAMSADLPRQHMAISKIKEENGAKPGLDSTPRPLLFTTTPSTATTSKGGGMPTFGRSPRKKLDSLLKMAEMRAAATANGGHSNGKEEGKAEENAGTEARSGDGEATTHNQQRGVNALLLGQHLQKRTDNVHASSSSNCSTSSSSSSTCRGHHSGNAIHNLHFNSLGSLLTNSVSNHLPNALSAAIISQNYHHQIPHNQSPSNHNHFNSSCSLANGGTDSLQSIQAIASRLSRGGTATGSASELSKALDGKTHQQQQKAMGHLVNGNWEKPNLGTTNNPMMMMVMGTAQQQQQQQLAKGAMVNGTGQHQQQQQMLVGELLKKYVENNPELAASAENVSSNSGSGTQSRNAGELACAMFMAQMVENAELRQEVHKLKAELDSLKALVAAAAVVGTNNGFDNGGNGAHGHHRQAH